MLVQEIANEPLFKDYIRHMFEEHAVIDILPTDRGKKEIDENHIYYVNELFLFIYLFIYLLLSMINIY